MYNFKIDNHIPNNEKQVYKIITALPKNIKMELWKIVLDSDKNNVVILNPLDLMTIYFVDNGFIVRNELYKGTKTRHSYFVLPNAPYLLREIKHLRKP